MPTAWCALSQNPLSLNNRVCPHAHSTTSPSTMRVLRDGPHGHTDAGQGQLLPTCPLHRSSLVGLALWAPHSPASARRPVFLPRLPSQTPQKGRGYFRRLVLEPAQTKLTSKNNKAYLVTRRTALICHFHLQREGARGHVTSR